MVPPTEESKRGLNFYLKSCLKDPWGRPLDKNPNIFGPHVKRTYICPGIQFSFSCPLKMQRGKTTFPGRFYFFRPILVLAAPYAKMDFCESFSVCSVPSRSPFVLFRRPEHFCARSLSPTRTTLKRYRSHPSIVMLLSRSNFDQLGQKKRSLPKKRVGICFKPPGRDC